MDAPRTSCDVSFVLLQSSRERWLVLSLPSRKLSTLPRSIEDRAGSHCGTPACGELLFRVCNVPNAVHCYVGLASVCALSLQLTEK
ncbi:hypothetical protein PISMIDRAFT_686707 [Pisolithus microcarpus 441]|uniref:Uncharacterized protein n=1 Tax=Pisolithus microcarpus 441 TaxID=765257 RepID=A0A0C9YQJ6_9AGAM|nr:hypothetical protein BKA83DRAFT_686707 [Pisolithus microcarpus]KIK16039.1 hypothetical protein PISMIDRAFT_686707 [Pisolithus microcarpus 441]